MSTDRRVVYALPSANPEMAAKHLPNWVAMGYRVIVGQDRVRYAPPAGVEVFDLGPRYLGYARSVSLLIASAVPRDAPVVVFGGDDMDPDPVRSAQQIAEEYLGRFPRLDGILQPVGDDMPGTRRICGSPWVGRVWLDFANNGAGPLFPGYFHFFGDEELFDVASAAGVLWQREDLRQRHDHWTRRGLSADQAAPIHAPLQARWEDDKRLYLGRRAALYPGALPPSLLPVVDWRRLPDSMSAPRPVGA